MTQPRLERFRRLAALAGSPNDHEALTAARLALGMLGQGGPLQVVEGDVAKAAEALAEQLALSMFERMRQSFLAQQPAAQPAPGEPGWEASPAGRWALAWAAREVARKTEAASAPPAEAPAPPEPPKPRRVNRAALKAATAKGWRYFPAAEYGGWCRSGCGVKVEPGEPTFWKRGQGILCGTCGEEQALSGELP